MKPSNLASAEVVHYTNFLWGRYMKFIILPLFSMSCHIHTVCSSFLQGSQIFVSNQPITLTLNQAWRFSATMKVWVVICHVARELHIEINFVIMRTSMCMNTITNYTIPSPLQLWMKWKKKTVQNINGLAKALLFSSTKSSMSWQQILIDWKTILLNITL